MYTIRDSLYTLKNRENGENSNFGFNVPEAIYTSQVPAKISNQ